MSFLIEQSVAFHVRDVMVHDGFLEGVVRLLIQWSAGALGLFGLECRLESSRSAVRLRTWL